MQASVFALVFYPSRWCVCVYVCVGVMQIETFYLVAALQVTRPQADWFVQFARSGGGINALVRPHVSNLRLQGPNGVR